MTCVENIQSLIAKSKQDAEMLKLLEECLLSFSEYHACIFKMETWLTLYGYDNMAKDDFQVTRTELDKSRSICHNAAISNIGILNRLCQQNNIPPVYSGVVSQERPHRVEIADAVLAYVQEVITNRIR